MSNIHSYILWLPSWYPNKLQPYNGDFVQRHAQAASLFADIEVIHVVKDAEGKVTHDVLVEVREHGRLRETIIYYYHSDSNAFISRIRSHLRYVKLYKKYAEALIAKRGLPALVHVYIVLKAGITGQWLQRKYQLRYVVSEQSTVYLDEARPGLKDENMFFRNVAAQTFKRAAGVMAVSDYLGSRLQQLFQIEKPVLIPNVVNTEIFNYQPKDAGDKATFVHVSNLNYQKNPEAIIEALQMVRNRGYQFLMHIIGPYRQPVIDMVHTCGLEEMVIFHHEMPQAELVTLVRQSDAMVLFSRYETFGCVMIEAFACGLPVILSDIPVFHENAGSSNALFAENENSVALADKMIEFIGSADKFQPADISSSAGRTYGFERVGDLMVKWYADVVANRK